jgi:hypothetical protein
MTTIALDLDTAELAVSGGGFTEVSGVNEIRQQLWIALNVHQGEETYNTDFGIPFADEIMAKGTPASRVIQIYREKILAVEGVTGFTVEPSVEFDAELRQWTLTFTADTDEGALVYDGPIALEPTQEVD